MVNFQSDFGKCVGGPPDISGMLWFWFWFEPALILILIWACFDWQFVSLPFPSLWFARPCNPCLLRAAFYPQITYFPPGPEIALGFVTFRPIISLVTYFHFLSCCSLNPASYFSLNCAPKSNSARFCLIFLPLCDKIFLPELTLRFVATFVVRISSAFPPDQSCQILFAPILSVAGQTLYLPIYLSACAFQKRIFEMHIFQLCQEQ